MASAGHWLLQLAVPAGFFWTARWPCSLLIRGAVAIVAVWVMTLVYVATVYNPAGVAFGIATGMDSPQTKFDNNMVASTLIGGWMYPTLSVIAALVIRVAVHRPAIK